VQSPLVGDYDYRVDHDVRRGTDALQDDGIGVHLRGGQQHSVGAGAEFGDGIGNGRFRAVADHLEGVVRGVARLP
jgi:hypothetical protein